MKLLIILFIISLSFCSCDSILDSNNTQTATGTIHKIGMTSWMYGTHTLDDSNGLPIYALKSSTIDLNNYDNKEVKVSGDLIKGYPVDGGPKYLNVTGITVVK
jgi:thioredoxin-related protein